MRIEIGEGFVLRPWDTADETALARHANNRKIWRNLRDAFPSPYTADDARAWINQKRSQSPITNLAIASPADAIGSIGLRLQDDVHRRSAEIGYWLAEPFWGHGVMTRAVRAMTDYAFANFDLVRLYASVFEWNPASMRVLEKAGFVREGRLRKSVTKDGKTIDSCMYALVREG